jgi:hypothetical protein
LSEDPEKPKDLAGIFDDFNLLTAEYDSLRALRKQRLDDGDTPARVSLVSGATVGNAAQVQDTLLNAAPYSSETVLLEYLSRTDLYSELQMVAVLSAHPDVLRSTAFWGAVLDHTPAFSSSNMDTLEVKRQEITLRTELEAQIGVVAADRSATGSQFGRVLSDGLLTNGSGQCPYLDGGNHQLKPSLFIGGTLSGTTGDSISAVHLFDSIPFIIHLSTCRTGCLHAKIR